MPDVRVNRERSEERRRTPGTVMRRESQGPSFWSLSPSEFFSASPFSLMRRFSEDMDRLFGGMWSGARGGETAEMGIWAPPIEVSQRDKEMVVCAELPGLRKEDVRVEVNEDGLIIEGERKHEQEHKEGQYYRSERSYGRFYRLIPLPEDANLEQARANFHDGVLEVTIPTPQSQQRRRQIPINEGARTTASTQSAHTETTGVPKTRTAGGGILNQE